MIYLEIAGLILFITILIAGFISILFGIPGTFVILVAAIIYALFTGFNEINLKLLIVLLAIVLLAEAIESLAGMLGSKGFGASKEAMWGALIGGILGAICATWIFPGIGSIIGAFVGAFFGSFGVEVVKGGEIGPSLKAGIGALVGRVGGMIAKLIFAAIMILLILTRIF